MSSSPDRGKSFGYPRELAKSFLDSLLFSVTRVREKKKNSAKRSSRLEQLDFHRGLRNSSSAIAPTHTHTYSSVNPFKSNQKEKGVVLRTLCLYKRRRKSSTKERRRKKKKIDRRKKRRTLTKCRFSLSRRNSMDLCGLAVCSA